MPTPNPWITRVYAEHRAGNLTAKSVFVLTTLRTFQGIGGACYPSHETLADRAGCSVRTVQRALQQARDLGLVTWAERRVRALWRWLRTSNAYRLHTPANPVEAPPRVVRSAPATNGQFDRGGESLGRKKALQAMMQEAAAAPDLLAMRRTAFAAMQAKPT